MVEEGVKPRLSVVVPVYNVEEYLEECLRSLADQSFRSLEVLMVDDGSTDGSTAIARDFAARDPRFRHVRRPNGGLSAARNTGVREADPDAEFLAFVDSDDVVPPDAYARMTGSLERTGSDFASGNVWRLNEQGRQQAWQYRWLVRDRERTHITRDPELLSDRVAWNKVFRRSFWDRHAFTFPEGKLYEDTPVMIPAHYLAEQVDVLTGHVYYWRVREGSITRRRTDVRGVTDRIAACAYVSSFLAGARPEQRPAYDLSCLRDDFVYFLEGLPQGGPAYRAAFMRNAAAFVVRADPSVLERLPADLRIKWHLVREGRLEDLIEVLAFERDNGKAVFDVEGRLRRSARYPTADGGYVRVPGRLARLGPSELPVVARLEEAAWGEDGLLRLIGHAYVRNVATASPRQVLKSGLLKNGRQVRPVPTRRTASRRATADSGQRLHSYDGSGFEMTVDPAKLGPGTWTVGIVTAGRGSVRRAAVRAVEVSAAQPSVRELGDGRRLAVLHLDGRLALRVETWSARVDTHRLVEASESGGPWLELGGELRDGLAPTALRLTRDGRTSENPVERLPDGRFTVRVPLADLESVPPPAHRAPKGVEPEHSARWTADLVLPGGRPHPLAAVLDLPPGHYGAAGVCAAADHLGRLVVETTRQPVVDRVEWDGERIVLAGSAPDTGDALLTLRHSARHEEATAPVRWDKGRFRAVLSPADPPLREGRWYVFLDDVPVRLLAGVSAALPLSREAGGRTFAVDRRYGDRLVVDSGSPLAPAERGAYRRHRLRTTHLPRHRAQPLLDTVLYLDGDSPLAVHEELVRRGADVEHLWVERDGLPPAPATARGVREHSAQWYEALARSRRIVTDRHLPDFFERRDGQTVVQTWNGAPLKRIGADLTDSLYADHHHLDALPRLARQWDVLVSPNTFSTPHLRRALSYSGEVLEAGSPRNDVLFAGDRAETAARVRAELGIEPGRRVVLYAPTFRDHLAYTPGHYRYEPLLDPAAVRRALGDDHVLLLRRHPLTTNTARGVRDVTARPRVGELLLIADVLITDYSALMFDFALTGRPMLFHTPDLEHYRDTVRGFYLDFEAHAPGPLLHGTEEVVEALRDLDGIAARHADAYEAFRDAYGDLDDGKASARVADRLLR
ncbi:CDP-glycerol glycerophosphotransferase family protein [Streptomyces sp. NPDC060194]|uniref:bifunctional glycosyltransferase/CDP-glycerol:glycerophosphate glycerophosphotransferase n=1 Tax=Streptomyces sp. NPDC060194 TaxID=3347069 RepID=UPI00364BB798